jgi:hypothetical protein
MTGEYLRVGAEELARAVLDPEWARGFADDVREAERLGQVPRTPAERHLSTQWTWHAIEFLLRRAGFPVDIVYGEEAFGQGAADWGYGPARYLTVERVRVAAGALGAVGFDELARGIGPADLAAAGVPPIEVWDEADPMKWVREAYESLGPFFASAVSQGQAMIVWID